MRYSLLKQLLDWPETLTNSKLSEIVANMAALPRSPLIDSIHDRAQAELQRRRDDVACASLLSASESSEALASPFTGTEEYDV